MQAESDILLSFKFNNLKFLCLLPIDEPSSFAKNIAPRSCISHSSKSIASEHAGPGRISSLVMSLTCNGSEPTNLLFEAGAILLIAIACFVIRLRPKEFSTNDD